MQNTYTRYMQLWEHKIVEINPLNEQCYRSVDLAR